MLNFRKPKFKFYHQLESTDCAAACLAMIMSSFGKYYAIQQVKNLFEFTRIGVSIQDILDVSPKLGIKPTALKLTEDDLLEIPLPAILYWKQEHFVVLEKVSVTKKKTLYHISDPSYGKIILDKEGFCNEWMGNFTKGVALVFEETDELYSIELPVLNRLSFKGSEFYKIFIQFLKNHKWKYIGALFLLLIGLGANWLIPFSFQKIIDLGIGNKSLKTVYALLLAQLILFLSSFISDFFSNVFLLKINFKLGIKLKEFLLHKLMKLPLHYFDTRLNTETLQRINDQNKIQVFLTWKGISLVISILNLIVFSSILAYYSTEIFGIYFGLSLFSVIWMLYFLKRREVLEYAMFLRQAENSNHVYEFIMNMPEIKINNAQKKNINVILKIQNKLNELELNSLFLNTYQLAGVQFLSKLKELIVIGFCAILITEDTMSLGGLLSISYILGQLSSPLENIINFLKDTQDAKIANERIGEIYKEKNENEIDKIESPSSISKIQLENINFKYPGKFSPDILTNISFKIPKNTVTAIVGASGSGKTTLLKLLLSYYPVKKGSIILNDDVNFSTINSEEWRKQCGAVLQEGKIFSTTIAENIAFSDEIIDYERLKYATRMAAIDHFIDELPMHYHTKIGSSGIELSGGQKQRILIARAVYKDPQFLFFDEATSALDAENEKIIHDNLQGFFKGKTVVIIAHRLSTVKNADNIIVLKRGEIVEEGTHQELVNKNGEYYNLVKNQLELGN